MPAKRRKKPKKRISGRMILVLLLLFCLLCCFLWMHAAAKITHVRKAEVYLPDLPAAFDGVKILFVSDLDIRTESDLKACTKLMRTLQSLHPDILMLGGDYTADTLFEILNGQTGGDELAGEFILSLADFDAPLGKFAVTGENDGDLSAYFATAGIEYLSDRCSVITRGSERLIIAGLSEVTLNLTPYTTLGNAFTGDECVIALAHNPSAYVGIRVSEAKNGGAWADLVLTGHNLGGQINLFGRSVRSMTDLESRTVSGWFYADDLPLLVSSGVGCKGPMLRFDSESQVHLITLRRQEGND